MMRQNILFVCIHNSARSQMAEAFLKRHAGKQFNAESAGLEPGELNPDVIKIMQEIGIDISGNKTQSVFELYKQDRKFDAVITVCDGASAEACPVFPGLVKRFGWSFTDPSKFTGGQDEVLAQTRIVRDEIEQTVLGFIKEYSHFEFARS